MNAVLIRGSLVGQVIDGRFSLLEWLGGSGTTGTFLTELAGPGSQKAAIKLFSTPAQAEDRLAAWKETSSFSHVHLARIVHFGRAEVDGAPVVYVVTELAEEVLSQIIPERALAADEAREMLEPILDALSYLHSKNYVHAHLRPSNIFVIENQVKLSAEGVLKRGELALELESSDPHNAPETAAGPIEPRADIWSLGMTLVEALTQQLPVWDSADSADPVLPELPKPFAKIARQCLHVDPAQRCSLSDIRQMLSGKTGAAAQTIVEEPVEPRADVAATEKLPSRRMPMVPLIVGFVLLVAIIVGMTLRSHKTSTAPVQTEATQQATPAEPESQPGVVGAAQPATSPAKQATTSSAKGDVLHRVIPDVPEKASNTIHGKIVVAIRTSVDPTGSVSNAEFTTHGASAYFARLAMEAAREWKFTPPQENGHAAASTWTLRFEFRRGSADATATQTSP